MTTLHRPHLAKEPVLPTRWCALQLAQARELLLDFQLMDQQEPRAIVSETPSIMER